MTVILVQLDDDLLDAAAVETVVVRGEHVPGPPHPRLHLVDDEQNAVPGRTIGNISGVQRQHGPFSHAAPSMPPHDTADARRVGGIRTV